MSRRLERARHALALTGAAVAAVVVVLVVSALVVLLRPGGAGPLTTAAAPGPLTPLADAPPLDTGEDGGGSGGLRPEVLRAVEAAVAAAAADGVDLRVTSGWRSAQDQRELFEEATRTYGSEREARRWVLPPEESEHVRGGAVDVGPQEGARWLDQHGARFGLCRRYDNEPWHFELLAAGGSACPAREPHP